MTFDQPAHFAGERVEALDHDPITGLKLTIDGTVCSPPESVKDGEYVPLLTALSSPEEAPPGWP